MWTSACIIIESAEDVRMFLVLTRLNAHPIITRCWHLAVSSANFVLHKGRLSLTMGTLFQASYYEGRRGLTMVKPRAGSILRLLVHEYIQSATPVPSENLARKSGLGVSSATVRNYMAELEEEGYILRPHISAGGIPSDKGYRFYVESMPAPDAPSREVREQIRIRFEGTGREWEAWVRLASTVLANLSRNLALVTIPRSTSARLRRIELVSVQQMTALLIVVFEEARVRQHVIALPQPMTPDEMMQLSNKLSAAFVGMGPKDIARKRVDLAPIEVLVRDQAVSVMRVEEELQAVEHAVDGLRLLLSQPEFQMGEKAREIAEALEGHVLLRYLLTETPSEGETKVVIGSENREETLRSFGMVLCRYTLPSGAMGIIGVVGPTRMAYDTTIGGIRYVAGRLEEMVSKGQS